jgi:Tol biopolymer transport system component
MSVAMSIAMSIAVAGCSDAATEPEPAPLPPPDTATYDLVFEQSAFPLNASHLRIRRRGEASNTLLFGRELLGIEPTASADGRTIVYQSYSDAVGDDSDLWLVRAGEAPTRVPLPVGETEFAPALSPDGSRLAYIRLGEDGNTQLWVSRLDGSERRLLSANGPTAVAANASPDWSPDGQRIAWATGAPGALRIAIINADGSGRQVVSSGVAGGSDIDAEWAPDGTRLVFVRSPAIAQSDLIVLTLASGVERALGLFSRNRHPAWAPDGKTIVFASTLGQVDGDYELYSIQPDGTALTPLTNDEVNQRHPVWVRRQ